VKLYHVLFELGGGTIVYIKAFLFFLDGLTVLMQALLIDGQEHSRLLQLVLIFNPLSMISPAAHNLGIVNHFLVTLCAFSILKNGFSGLSTDLACGLALYQDPTIIFVLAPLRVISSKTFSSVSRSIVLWVSIYSGLVWTSGDIEGDMLRQWNIIAVKDHTETIGLFWYIYVELFKQHISFYRCLYLLFFTVLSAIIYLNLRTYDQYKTAVA
jgi:hypothetical protein